MLCNWKLNHNLKLYLRHGVTLFRFTSFSHSKFIFLLRSRKKRKRFARLVKNFIIHNVFSQISVYKKKINTSDIRVMTYLLIFRNVFCLRCIRPLLHFIMSSAMCEYIFFCIWVFVCSSVGVRKRTINFNKANKITLQKKKKENKLLCETCERNLFILNHPIKFV